MGASSHSRFLTVRGCPAEVPASHTDAGADQTVRILGRARAHRGRIRDPAYRHLHSSTLLHRRCRNREGPQSHRPRPLRRHSSPVVCSFFFYVTATPEIYTLPLHAALPI